MPHKRKAKDNHSNRARKEDIFLGKEIDSSFFFVGSIELHVFEATAKNAFKICLVTKSAVNIDSTIPSPSV